MGEVDMKRVTLEFLAADGVTVVKRESVPIPEPLYRTLLSGPREFDAREYGVRYTLLKVMAEEDPPVLVMIPAADLDPRNAN
jgi:hypothetical protein